MIKGIIYGIVGAMIYDKLRGRIALYKWSCPDPVCTHKIWTNTQSRLDRDILEHREEHI